MIYYEGRLFRPSTENQESDTTPETIFKYHQKGDLLTGTYSGGYVEFGQLIGLVNIAGRIDMRYHHINTDGDLMTGICRSIPEILESGKIRLHESWQWTCKDRAKGTSILDEL